ncbi:hypothetical protein K438DRAFT_1954914 [Mycena galopus ATCC 62051]|nr:hypothetical protein K438DRAFT_1954914 [Mycena galopus ATCC 62051]
MECMPIATTLPLVLSLQYTQLAARGPAISALRPRRLRLPSPLAFAGDEATPRPSVAVSAVSSDAVSPTTSISDVDLPQVATTGGESAISSARNFPRSLVQVHLVALRGKEYKGKATGCRVLIRPHPGRGYQRALGCHKLHAVIAKRVVAPGITDIQASPHGHDIVPVKSAVKHLISRGYLDFSKLYKGMKAVDQAYLHIGSTSERGMNRVVFGKAVNLVLDKLTKEEAAAKVMVIDSDLEDSTGLKVIHQKHPEVFIPSGFHALQGVVRPQGGRDQVLRRRYEFVPGKDETIVEGKAGYVGLDLGLINEPSLDVVDEQIGSSLFVLVIESFNQKTGLGFTASHSDCDRNRFLGFVACAPHWVREAHVFSPACVTALSWPAPSLLLAPIIAVLPAATHMVDTHICSARWHRETLLVALSSHGSFACPPESAQDVERPSNLGASRSVALAPPLRAHSLFFSACRRPPLGHALAGETPISLDDSLSLPTSSHFPHTRALALIIPLSWTRRLPLVVLILCLLSPSQAPHKQRPGSSPAPDDPRSPKRKYPSDTILSLLPHPPPRPHPRPSSSHPTNKPHRQNDSPAKAAPTV